METLNFSVGDRVLFSYNIDASPSPAKYEVVITQVDITSGDGLPYLGENDNGNYWFGQSDIITKIGDGATEYNTRVEAKLDAIISHFNIPFEF